ncbi:MAG: L,D-transpeptidase [Myxococcota bacterium]
MALRRLLPRTLPRILLARMLLSACMLSGCSPERDTEPQFVRPLDQAETETPEPAPATAESDASDLELPDETPKLHGLHRHVWVRARPSTRSRWIGYLGLAGAVNLRDEPTVPGDGCSAFQPIAPRGFVCLDHRATLDPQAPALVALRNIAPRLESPWPHHYAESRQTPRYTTLPTLAQQQRREFQLQEHLGTVASLRRGAFEGDVPTLLEDVDVALSGRPMPGFLSDLPSVHEHVATVKAGSTLSYAYSFDADGRSWIVTGDGVLIPKDRVAPYRRSQFEGMHLGSDLSLPVGFIRGDSAPQFIRRDGVLVARGAKWSRHAGFGLTGGRAEQHGTVYLETHEGVWVEQQRVTRVAAAPETPWGERVAGGGTDIQRWSHTDRVPPPGPRRTWIEVSVHEGWLIAYEGTRPVFATLVATGRGEPVAPGGRSLQTSTPPGIFALQGKYWTSTMAVNSTAHFDVPFVMPYFGAYALHASYWHDQWGEKVSLGCVNLAPIDARWVFLWAEPAIPEGWHGMRVTPDTGPGTVVVVHA